MSIVGPTVAVTDAVEPAFPEADVRPAREPLQEVTPQSINTLGVSARRWPDDQEQPTSDRARVFAL